ncbi:MAG: hypothetical protein JXR23_01870 [Pontiellaceae bacterium]|nr:hypothetical protein [Pontiellaceae bacterium]
MTITNGYSDSAGGGIFCSDMTPVVTNCTISGNSASRGGGMYYGTANNCTISGNSADYGGGMRGGGTANNCIVYGNKAPQGNDIYYNGKIFLFARRDAWFKRQHYECAGVCGYVGWRLQADD